MGFVICGLLFAHVAWAQAMPDPVQYAVAPETPGPGERVLIQTQGVGSFLGNATITWTQDGVVTKKGVGEQSYSFVAPALGQSTTVRVSIDSSSQGALGRTFTFTPSLVNLMWEADTTVPPLYRGKPLYSAGSPLRVIAFPIVYQGGRQVAASALSYQWSVNDNPLPDRSGLGRFILSYTGDQLQTSEQISVDAYYGTAKVGHGELIVPASTPELLLYQRDALRGVVLDQAMPAGIALGGKEITLQAQPFYFSNTSRAAGALTYSWQIDGETTTGPDAARGVLTLRQTGEGVGEAGVLVGLQNYGSSTFVQSAEAALRIVFGQQTGSLISNLFGL